jgi:hypothetical protein
VAHKISINIRVTMRATKLDYNHSARGNEELDVTLSDYTVQNPRTQPFYFPLRENLNLTRLNLVLTYSIRLLQLCHYFFELRDIECCNF